MNAQPVSPKRFYEVIPPLVPLANPRSINTTLPRELYNEIVELAIQRNLSTSRMIYLLLRNALEQEKATEE